MSRFLRLGEKISKVSICGNDILKYSIVLDGNIPDLKGTPYRAKPNVAKAASVLQDYIFKITDVQIPVLYDIFPLHTDKEIRVGVTNRGGASGEKDFGDDDFSIVTEDGNVSINGGKRGVLYGVYTFLEKYLGVRFFTKTCEKILYRERFDIGEIDLRFHTPFEYRDICCWTGWDPDFSVKSKINGSFSRNLREEDGGMIGFAGGFAGLAHTFDSLVPEKLYDTHPEYFALTEEGKRDPSGLCLSSEDVLNTAYRTACEWLDREADPRIISVSINDGHVAYCRCKKCKEMIERGGNDTDLVMRFVNGMQRKLKKKYPRVSVVTLAYAACLQTPKIVLPDPDVTVEVCGMGVRNVPFDEAVRRYENGEEELKYNAEFVHITERWSNIAQNIYVWDYPYDYSVVNSPFPVVHTLLKNTRFFADRKAKGMYINGQTDCAEFTELKFYLQAKAMAEPYMTEEEYEKHLDEFLEGYYGDGWQYIKEYIALSEKACRYIKTSKEPAENIPLPKNADGTRNDEFLKRGNALFQKAYDAAANDGERRRVRKCWLQLDYYELYSFMDEDTENASAEKKAEYIRRNEKMYDELRGLGITRIGERTFMPVVKNFAQSPVEHLYWDYAAVTGDRNNETYERELYVLVPFNDAAAGAKIDFECSYKTNNENESGYLGVYDGEKIADTTQNPTWISSKKYEKNVFHGAEITTAAEFAKKSGFAQDGLYLRYLPRHLKGAVLRVKAMDAGAYMFVREPKIIAERVKAAEEGNDEKHLR